MKRHPIIPALAILALTIAVLPAAAQRQVDETRQVDDDATIQIQTMAGSVTVTGWDKNEVHITGTLDEQAEELAIEGGGGRLSIEVKYPDRVKEIDGSELKIMVPRGAEVDVSTIAADVAVDKVRGELDIETVSGEVMLRGEPREVEVETVSGNLDLDVETDVASVACVSGDIKVAGVRRELECAVVSGDIDVLAGKEMSSLECETVSGDVTVTGELPRGADWSLAVHSGDIVLNLQGEVNAEFDIESFSGEIHDVFGHAAERTSKYAPGSELSCTVGDGGAKVEIEAFSGDVKVRKK
jgi:DUF4097 and DUF4098 domain-containing protein YvlB